MDTVVVVGNTVVVSASKTFNSMKSDVIVSQPEWLKKQKYCINV